MGKKTSHRSRSNSRTSVDKSGKSRKRPKGHSKSSTTSKSRSPTPVAKKRAKKTEEKKHSKKRSSSTSSTDSTNSGSSGSSSTKRRTKRKKSEKSKRKREKKKLKKKMKKEKRRLRKEAAATLATSVVKNKSVKKADAVEKTDDLDPLLADRAKAMAPMTKEEWEKRQSVIKKVYDEETGRHRIIKGDGEVIEEIVSKDRHREINKQATQGDGAFFQARLASNARR